MAKGVRNALKAEPMPATPATCSQSLPAEAADRRAALAEQILLDALRVSWSMSTSTTEAVFGGPERLADFAVRAADALWCRLGELKSSNKE